MIDIDVKEFKAFLKICKKLSAKPDLRRAVMITEDASLKFVGHNQNVSFTTAKRQDYYRWCYYENFIDVWSKAVGKCDKTAHLSIDEQSNVTITTSCKEIEEDRILPQGGFILSFNKKVLHDAVKDITPKIDNLRGMKCNNLLLQADGHQCAVSGYNYQGQLVGGATVPLMYGSDWYNVKEVFIPLHVCDIIKYMPLKTVHLTLVDGGMVLQSGRVRVGCAI